MLPAYPRGREPGAAVGRAAGRDDRRHRLRPLTFDSGAQGPGERRLRRGLGWYRLGSARAVADLDGGAATGTRAGAGDRVDGHLPAQRVGLPAKGSWPSATTPTSQSSLRTRPSSSMPPNSTTRTPSPPTRARRSQGWCGVRSCVAGRWISSNRTGSCCAVARSEVRCSVHGPG